MKKSSIIVLFVVNFFLSALPVSAGQIKCYVGEFVVIGVQNNEELRKAVPALLASRLNGAGMLAVDNAADADVTVTGSYIAFGKVFNIDSIARKREGTVVARAFEQGEGSDQMIPAIGKLAGKLSASIISAIDLLMAEKPQAAGPPTIKPVTAATATPPGSGSAPLLRSNDSQMGKEEKSPTGSVLVRPIHAEASSSVWISQRLAGTLVGMATGSELENGRKELYIIDNHVLRLYRQEDELKLIAEVSFGPNEHVLGIDTADLDGDGRPEAYVTIMSSEELSSQVWTSRHNGLQKIADKLPYFFRGIALAGGEKKIYAQQMGRGTSGPYENAYGRRSGDFFGDVYELIKSGDRYELKNPIALPPYAFLYNFNVFTDSRGQSNYVVISDDGYLIVYSHEREELWRSSYRFGGSDLFFRREDLANVKLTGKPDRWIFLEQRLVVTKDGVILVPQNGGFLVFGNNRSYNKNSVFAFRWNGARLNELWHTMESQNYLADYFYDESRKELFLLEVIKKEGITEKGASVVEIKKVE